MPILPSPSPSPAARRDLVSASVSSLAFGQKFWRKRLETQSKNSMHSQRGVHVVPSSTYTNNTIHILRMLYFSSSFSMNPLLSWSRALNTFSPSEVALPFRPTCSKNVWQLKVPGAERQKYDKQNRIIHIYTYI